MARPGVARHLVGSEPTTTLYVTPAKLMIVLVLKEVLVVQKQLVPKEELHVQQQLETKALLGSV
jgi:hypothetical protein